ncbi:MAG: hypothetical protein QOE93_1922, partial [Actinomycetota bacterium]|nr:hypothetical protein [Actinomycetota bacterium]
SLLIVLAERIDPRQALIAATGWGGDAYVDFPRDGHSCLRLNVTGDTDADTDELEDALVAWVDAAPDGSAETSRSGDVVYLESCDPGSSAAGGTGGSEEAMSLAVSRSYVAVSALADGAEEEQAECFASALVLGLTLDELGADETTPALDRKIAGIVSDCR